MIYLVWVAVFFCIAGALALLFDEHMEYCLAPALCGSILLLYLFGLFGLLKPGIAAVALCGAVSAGYPGQPGSDRSGRLLHPGDLPRRPHRVRPRLLCGG